MKRKLILAIVLLLFMLLVISLLYALPIQANNYEQNKNTTIVGNDRDAHGCIGSAGYQWCQEKNKCLRIWEENCSSIENNNTNNNTLPGEGKNKILPDTASEIAKQRLGDLGFNITLKDVGQNKTVYFVEAEKQGKFLGLFKTTAKVSTEIDSQTGEILKVHKPWWSFLAGI